jgi:hypothetical protein
MVGGKEVGALRHLLWRCVRQRREITAEAPISVIRLQHDDHTPRPADQPLDQPPQLPVDALHLCGVGVVYRFGVLNVQCRLCDSSSTSLFRGAAPTTAQVGRLGRAE